MPSLVAVNQTSWPSADHAQTLLAQPIVRQRFLASIQVHHRHCATIISAYGMIHEGNAITLARNARMADPADRLIEDLSHGVFQAVAATNIAHDGKIVTVRPPVGPLDAFQDLAGCATLH